MNKRQKQLIKTYFRKRNNMVETEWHAGQDGQPMNYRYEPYEITDFTIKNFGVDKTFIDDSREGIEKFIVYDPSKAYEIFGDDVIDDYLENDSNMFSVTNTRPDLIPKLAAENLYRRYPNELFILLYNKPEAIKYFSKHALNLLSSRNIAMIISKKPELYQQYFSNVNFTEIHSSLFRKDGKFKASLSFIQKMENFKSAIPDIFITSPKLRNQIKPYLNSKHVVTVLEKKPDLWKELYDFVVEEISYLSKHYNSANIPRENKKHHFWIAMKLVDYSNTIETKHVFSGIIRILKFDDFNSIPNELFALIKKYNPENYNVLMQIKNNPELIEVIRSGGWR